MHRQKIRKELIRLISEVLNYLTKDTTKTELGFGESVSYKTWNTANDKYRRKMVIMSFEE